MTASSKTTETKTPENQRDRQTSPQAIDAAQVIAAAVKNLPLEYLQSQKILPIKLDNGEVVAAMADPDNLEAYDAVCMSMGRPLRKIVYPARQIDHAISKCYYQDENAFADSEDEDARHDTYNSIRGITDAEDLLSISDKSPLIKLVNKILFQAANNRASDIHIEPFMESARIRFRVDGVLHDVMQIPKESLAPLIARIKIMSNLNIAERRLPQDGQSRIKIGDSLMDVRISIIPTLSEERVTMRIMEKNARKLMLDKIGMDAEVLQKFRQMLAISHGIILITGPTGSGKTTTLYAALNELNSEQINILTVEDPIEYQLPGIGQMQVKPKIDLTFANCLRHILRQDPDMIMIGEIRDLETAQIAIQSSLTGHLVLSTLHTNDAASAVTRLIDMGIEPYLISSSVIGVMAQRLVRVICPDCKTPASPEQNLVEQNTCPELADIETLYQGDGCDNCMHTGYRGRSGIFELMPISNAVQQLILKRASDTKIKQTAISESMRTLRRDGLMKVADAVTTIEEVYRVTQDSAAAFTNNQNL